MSFERRRLILRILAPLAVFYELRLVLAPIHPREATVWALTMTIPVIAVLILTFYINVAIHEGGHWLAGRLVGFEPNSLQIGPFLWRVTAEGTRFQLSPWRGRVAGFAGMWPESSERLQSRFALFVLGGPAANLLSLAILYPLFRSLPAPDRLSTVGFLGEIAAFFLFLYALMLGLINLIPFHAQGMATDGRKLLTILQGGPRFKRMMALLQLSNLMRLGTRPRDYPPEMMQALLSSPDGSTEHAQALLLNAYYSFDTGHDEEAVQLATEAAQTISPRAAIHHAVMTNDAAGMVAWLGGGAPSARALLEKSNPRLLMYPFARPRSEAAVLLAEGRYSEALEYVRQADDLLSTELRTSPEMFKLERDWIRAIKDRIERGLAA